MESKIWWSIVLLIISCVMLFTIRKRNPTGSIKNGICWIIVIVSTIFSLLELVLSKYENICIMLIGLNVIIFIKLTSKVEKPRFDQIYFNILALYAIYNPQIQISAESETKRSIFREKDKTKRSKKESAQHSKSRNKSFVMTSVSAL